MKKLLSRFAQAGTLLVIIGCSDMGEPELLLPFIDVDSTAIDFSEITINSEQTQQIIISNVGDSELSGNLALIQDSTAYRINPTGAFAIDPSDSLVVELSFMPLSDAIYAAELLISSNDPDLSEISINVSGQGTSEAVPVLTLSSSALSFGTLLSGDNAQKQFTLSNTGTDTLIISSISLGLTSYQSDLILPLSLNPGESQLVTITFQPVSVGTFNTNLTIVSNASLSPHQVSITGAAENLVSYASSVQPVWDANCTGCHGNSAGLNLASYASLMSGANSGAVVTPGDGANSKIIRKLRGTSGSQMPLNGTPLSAGTINTIETWINQGALNN